MILGLKKGQTNSGSFKKGERKSRKTEFKKGQKPWNKGKILVPLDEQRKKLNKQARVSYAKNKDKMRKKNRTWYQKHKESEKIRGKKYHRLAK